MLSLQVLDIYGTKYITQESVKELYTTALLSEKKLKAVFMFDDFYFDVTDDLDTFNVQKYIIDVGSFINNLSEVKDKTDTEELDFTYYLAESETECVFTIKANTKKCKFIALCDLEYMQDKYNKRLILPMLRVRGKVYIACNMLRSDIAKKYLVIA